MSTCHTLMFLQHASTSHIWEHFSKCECPLHTWAPSTHGYPLLHIRTPPPPIWQHLTHTILSPPHVNIPSKHEHVPHVNVPSTSEFMCVYCSSNCQKVTKNSPSTTHRALTSHQLLTSKAQAIVVSRYTTTLFQHSLTEVNWMRHNPI